MSGDVRGLAELLRTRDELDSKIAEMTGRSARQGDVGEFIAAQVFDIELAIRQSYAASGMPFCALISA